MRDRYGFLSEARLPTLQTEHRDLVASEEDIRLRSRTGHQQLSVVRSRHGDPSRKLQHPGIQLSAAGADDDPGRYHAGGRDTSPLGLCLAAGESALFGARVYFLPG